MPDSDSDYNSMVLSDTETDDTEMSSSDEEEEELFEMTEQDWQELYEVIDILIYDIIQENISQISNANIYKEIAGSIFDII